jgi:hypothetical protein
MPLQATGLEPSRVLLREDPDWRRQKMSRRLITVLATGLLLLAGFTAAAVASGGSPLHLLASPATTTRGAGSSHGAKPKRAVTPASPRASTAEDPDTDTDTDEESADDKPEKTTTQSGAKVVLCHHTGSWKHPFHAISVDDHAVPAHTRHGDTLGNCPSAAASEPRTTTHGKPPWAQGPKKHTRGQSSEHGGARGNSGHEEEHGRGVSSARKNSGKKH